MKKILIMSAITAAMLTSVSAESALGDMLNKMKESVASMSEGAKASIEAVKSTKKTTEEVVAKAEGNTTKEAVKKTEEKAEKVIEKAEGNTTEEAVKKTEEKAEKVTEKVEGNTTEKVEKTENNESDSFINKVKDIFK